MTLSPELKTAFRFHMRNNRPAFYYAQGYNGKNAYPEKAVGIAVVALARARDDLVKGTRRYPDPIRQTYRASESDGLRFIGRVVPETNHAIFDTRGDSGWYTDPHGDVFKNGHGLCFGVVYQLPGRKGESRFVAGFEFGGTDGGPSLDLSRMFTEPKGPDSYWLAYGDKDDITTLRQAARHADSLAKTAAEGEREYQAAWGAGSAWAQEGETIKHARKEAIELLSERRAVKRMGNFEHGAYRALCAAIRSQVSGHLETITQARETRAELAAGDSEPYYFWQGDARLQDAFCEGAGLESFPA